MEINFDDAPKREKGQLLFIGSPRQYRSDCQAGQFKIGATRMLGKKLEMQLIAARVIEDELFGYGWQKWVSVIFADQEGIVSTILFKTESMDNFFELYRQAMAEGVSLTTKTVVATMSKRASKATGGSYFAVEFEITGDGLYTEAIAEFKLSCNLGELYRINTSPPALTSPE